MWDGLPLHGFSASNNIYSIFMRSNFFLTGGIYSHANCETFRYSELSKTRHWVTVRRSCIWQVVWSWFQASDWSMIGLRMVSPLWSVYGQFWHVTRSAIEANWALGQLVWISVMTYLPWKLCVCCGLDLVHDVWNINTLWSPSWELLHLLHR